MKLYGRNLDEYSIPVLQGSLRCRSIVKYIFLFIGLIIATIVMLAVPSNIDTIEYGIAHENYESIFFVFVGIAASITFIIVSIRSFFVAGQIKQHLMSAEPEYSRILELYKAQITDKELYNTCCTLIDNKTKAVKIAKDITFIVAFVIGASIGFILSSLTDLGYIVSILISTIPCVLLGCAISAIINKSSWSGYKIKQALFLARCIENKIKNINNKNMQKKATLIANEYGIAFDTIEEYFFNTIDVIATKTHEIEQAREKAEYELIRSREKKIEQELTRYANLENRSKRIAMLTDMKAIEDKNARSYARCAQNACDVLLEKEMDVATHAGIANGLAGSAAAIKTAIDIEMKNAAIRQRNIAKYGMVTEVQASLSQKAQFAQDHANILQKQIEKAQFSLISDTSQKKILENLDFYNESVSITKTGAVTISVDVATNHSEKIEGNPTVVDGTIAANIYQNNKHIGTALLVLPVYGLNAKKTEHLEGICLTNANQDIEECKVYYESHNLCIIEQI